MMWTFASPFGGGSTAGVEVAGTLVGVGIAIVVTAGLDEDAVVVVAAVLVAIAGVLVPVTSGVLEAAVESTSGGSTNAVDTDWAMVAVKPSAGTSGTTTSSTYTYSQTGYNPGRAISWWRRAV